MLNSVERLAHGVNDVEFIVFKLKSVARLTHVQDMWSILRGVLLYISHIIMCRHKGCSSWPFLV